MPFQPPPGAPQSFPPAGPPVHQTTLPPPPPGWAPPAAWGPPPVTAGSLLSRSLRVWWGNLGKLATMMLLAFVPGLLAIFLLSARSFSLAMEGGQPPPPDPSTVFGAFFVLMAVMLPLATMVFGGLNYGVIQWLAGRPAGVGDMLGQGARRLWRLILVNLLLGLAFMGGYVLLIVPGIMIAVATCVAVPAAMVEGGGPVASFQRSLELTRGFRWSLFGALLALGALYMLVWMAGLFLAIIPFVGIFLFLGVALAMCSIPYVLPAVAYHDLRVLKEGVDTTQLSRVFE